MVNLDYDGDYIPTYWQSRNPGAKWTPAHGIDDFVKQTYTAGECGALALVLHEMFGWALYLEADGVEPDGTVEPVNIAHIWVKNHEGRAVDILGVHKHNFAWTLYTRRPGTVLRVKPAQVRKLFTRKHFLAWARRIIRHFPEHFGITATLKPNKHNMVKTRRYTKSRPLKCTGKVNWMSRSQVHVSLFMKDGEVCGGFPRKKFPKAALYKGAIIKYEGWYEGTKEVCRIRWRKPTRVTKAMREKIAKEVARSLKGIDWENL